MNKNRNLIIEGIEKGEVILLRGDYAISYLRSLYHACYLACEYDDYDRDPIYNLNYNTGPFAPSVRRGKAIFDPNLGVMVS